MSTNIVVTALQGIANRNGGLLKPESVVEAARPTNSPLHDYFTWDDDAAADAYRLIEARSLIRTTVQYLETSGEKVSFRVFCSLTPDRQLPGGGYRQTVEVMGDLEMREQLLQDAIAEMTRFQEKYKRLAELSAVFAEMARATAKQKPISKKKSRSKPVERASVRRSTGQPLAAQAR